MTPGGRIRTTEIGSVPDLDPIGAVERAVAEHPEMPSAPEMPRRDPLEGMVPRALELFPYLQDPLTGRVALRGDDPALAHAIASVQARAPTAARAAGLRAFLAAPGLEGVPRPKAAVIGPVALARSLSDVRGRPLSEFPDVAEAIGKFVGHLAFSIAWEMSASCADGFVVQIDEPGTTDTLTGAEEERIRHVERMVNAAFGLVSLHDCGARTGAGFVRLRDCLSYVSFDATRDRVPLLDAPRPDLADLFSKVGVVWGVVPTDGRPAPVPSFGRDLLARATSAVGDESLARRDAWFSPACGLGGLDDSGASRVRDALRATATA